MIAEIRIPKLGMTQEDIVIVEITRRNGDAIQKEDKIAAIETAKVTYDIVSVSLLFHFLRKNHGHVANVPMCVHACLFPISSPNATCNQRVLGY